MGKKHKDGLPDEILVYREKDGDLSYLVVSDNVRDIPESHSGNFVGAYYLHQKYKFKVKRELM